MIGAAEESPAQRAANPLTPPDELRKLSVLHGYWVAQNPSTPLAVLAHLDFVRRWLPLVEQNPIWPLVALEAPEPWLTQYRSMLDRCWIWEARSTLSLRLQRRLIAQFAEHVSDCLLPFQDVYVVVQSQIQSLYRFADGRMTENDLQQATWERVTDPT